MAHEVILQLDRTQERRALSDPKMVLQRELKLK
jgi:hypothetical protein